MRARNSTVALSRRSDLCQASDRTTLHDLAPATKTTRSFDAAPAAPRHVGNVTDLWRFQTAAQVVTLYPREDLCRHRQETHVTLNPVTACRLETLEGTQSCAIS